MDEYIKQLAEKLEKHFTELIADISSTVQQALVTQNISAANTLAIYLTYVKDQRVAILKQIDKPEQFAELVIKYLNKHYNLRNNAQSPDVDVVDLTDKPKAIISSRKSEQELKDLIDMQELAKKIKPGSKL